MRLGILMALNSPWSREVAVRIAELGHSVHVIDFLYSRRKKNNPPERFYLHKIDVRKLMENGITIHYLKTLFNSHLRYFTSVFSLRSICLKNEIEVLLILYGGGYSVMTFLSGFRPYVIYTVGSDVLFANWIKRIINSFCYRFASAIFSNGKYLAFKTRELTKTNNIISLYLGVNANRFSSIRTNSKKNVIVLCTRGFLPVYNNEYLLQGLKLLPKNVQYEKVIFTSAGPTLRSVQTFAKNKLSSSVKGKLHFYGGISDDEMLQNLQQADVFVSLSRSDGTSISLLEALSCGLFPVVSDIPQNREWIDPKIKNGILVPLDQPKDLAKALERALTDTGLRERASSINRQIILDRADAYKNIAKLTFHLKEIARTCHLTDKNRGKGWDL